MNVKYLFYITITLIILTGEIVYANHILEMYIYIEPYNIKEYDTDIGVINIKEGNKSIIVTSKGEKPLIISYNSNYIYTAINTLQSNLILSVTKNIPLKLILPKIITYLRNLNPACYFSFGSNMQKRCTTTLTYTYDFNLTSNFNYLYPGNYLFKIIRTFNSIIIEKR